MVIIIVIVARFLHKVDVVYRNVIWFINPGIVGYISIDVVFRRSAHHFYTIANIGTFPIIRIVTELVYRSGMLTSPPHLLIGRGIHQPTYTTVEQKGK